MKILTLVGSGRKQGNTASVVELLSEELRHIAETEKSDLEFETVFLLDAGLKACIGCRMCFERGVEQCPLQDDLLVLRDKVREADFLILASPVYVEDVSGLMKTYIDRMAYSSHRPEFGQKMGFALMTYGSSATNHTLRTMSLAMGTWGIHVVGQRGFFGGGLRSKERLDELHADKIKKTAVEIYQSLKGKAYLEPNFSSLMMFAIQQKSWRNITERSLDLEYWLEKGWLKPGVTFYHPHDAGAVKTMTARFAGKVISLFVQ